MADVETSNKDAELRVSDLEEEEEDLEVISAVVEQEPDSTYVVRTDDTRNQDTSQSVAVVAPPASSSSDGDRRSSGWSGFFGKRFGSGKGETETPQKKRDWTKEQEAFSRFKTSAANTFSQMGSRMGESGSFLYEASKRRAQATAESLKKIRIFKTPLESLCKGESTNHPCPRLMLICCTAIASSGVSCPEIFKSDPPEELVTAVLNLQHYGHGAVLPPAGATPEVLAGVIKKFLSELMEPLFTFKLVEEWIEAAGDFSRIKMIIQQLPAVNRNVLELLLDCLHRVSANAEENKMDPDTLAEALVPCLIWRAPKPSSEPSKKVEIFKFLKFMFFQVSLNSGSIVRRFSRTSESEGEEGVMKEEKQGEGVGASDGDDSVKNTVKVEIQGEEFQKLVAVVSFMIANYKAE